MQPTQRIHPDASRVNKLTIVNRKLCYKGVECDNVLAPPEGIDNLVGYLQTKYPMGVVLIAHNGARFDFPRLKRHLEKNENFLKSNYVIECIDSIQIFKKHFPALEAYNQRYLIKRFLGSEKVSDAHEAVGDCENLRDALESAAQETNMPIAEFLDMPCKKLIADSNKGKSKEGQPKSRAPKVKRLQHVDMLKRRTKFDVSPIKWSMKKATPVKLSPQQETLRQNEMRLQLHKLNRWARNVTIILGSMKEIMLRTNELIEELVNIFRPTNELYVGYTPEG